MDQLKTMTQINDLMERAQRYDLKLFEGSDRKVKRMIAKGDKWRGRAASLELRFFRQTGTWPFDEPTYQPT